MRCASAKNGCLHVPESQAAGLAGSRTAGSHLQDTDIKEARQALSTGARPHNRAARQSAAPAGWLTLPRQQSVSIQHS